MQATDADDDIDDDNDDEDDENDIDFDNDNDDGDKDDDDDDDYDKANSDDEDGGDAQLCFYSRTRERIQQQLKLFGRETSWKATPLAPPPTPAAVVFSGH